MIDLHTHSTYSDGTLSPTELYLQAEQLGLTAVALCDHNTVDGLPEFMAAAHSHTTEAVAGVEFSTDYGDTELHILGLFIPQEHYQTVTTLLQEVLERKEQSNLHLIQGLNEAGLALDYQKIKDSTPGGLVNRAVIAAEMTRLGYTSSVKDAFDRWLAPKHGYFRPPRRLDCFETIRFIRSIGAVSVLAHPFLNLKEPELRVFLKQAVAEGLDGMETHYTKFDAATTQLASHLCAEFGLLESGGSDFHGANKPDTQLGIGRGSLLVPDSFFMQLRNRRLDSP